MRCGHGSALGQRDVAGRFCVRSLDEELHLDGARFGEVQHAIGVDVFVQSLADRPERQAGLAWLEFQCRARGNLDPLGQLAHAVALSRAGLHHVSLAHAIDKLEAYRFTPKLNETTRAYFTAKAKMDKGPLGDAMRRWLANPKDGEAADIIEASESEVGRASQHFPLRNDLSMKSPPPRPS